MRSVTLVWLPLLLLAAACTPSAPPRPPSEAPVPPPPLAPSHFGARVSVGYQDLAALLETRLPPRLIDETKDLGHGFKADVTLDRGPITISGAGSGLALRTNFTFNSRVHGTCLFVVKCEQSFQASGTISAQSQLALALGWRVTTATSTDFTLSACRLALGPIGLPCINLLDGLLRPKLAQIGPMLDQSVSAFDLRAEMAKAWAGLSAPQRLSADPPLWLSIDPESLTVSPPANANGAISVSAAIDARPQLLLSQDPPPPARARSRRLPSRPFPPTISASACASRSASTKPMRWPASG